MIKFYLTILFTCILVSNVFSQSVLNPADPIVTYNSSAPPTQPAWGQIGKWVRTSRLSWNTSEYKCYIYKGCAFRLHFPKSYNPTANDGKKYPMLVFFHGLGETGTIYDNEYQLYHGGDVFNAAVDNGTFDGYVLCMQSQGFWGAGQYQYISEIIDYMIANNKLDPFAISANGLSAGGQGTWEMLFSHPTYIASDIPMSQVDVSYQSPDTINKVKFTPVWNVQGGLDGAPAPSTAHQVRDAMLAGGANYTYTEFPTQGHDTWDSTWLLPDFWPYMLRAYSANPWTLYGRTAFCPTDIINVTIGLAPGFNAYQWRYNGTIIPNATTNTIQVTQPGTYDARVLRGSLWSDWSRTPVQITIKTATVTPPIQVSGLMSIAIPAADGKNYVNLQVAGSYASYAWKRVGSDSIVGTQQIYTATQPGYYIASVTEQYGCSSNYSPAYKVINANGINAPVAAKSLLANAISNTQIQLSWSQPVHPVNAPTAFEIYRGVKSGGPYTFISQVSPTIINYADSNLTPKTKYFYVVRAIDSTAAAPLSNEANAATFSDTIPPSIPLNLKSTYTTSSTITIAWSASTDNVAVDHYAIYVNGVLSNVTKTTSFILTGLTQNQAYSIYVKAVDGSNNYSSASNQISASPILGGLQYSYYTTTTAWSKLPNFAILTPVAQGISQNTDITVATQTTNYGFLWKGYIQVPVSGTYIFETTSDDGSALWFNSLTPTGTPLVSNDGAHASQSVTGTITLTAGIYPICIEYFQAGGGANMSVSWACSALFGNTTQHAIANSYFAGTPTSLGAVPAVPTGVTAAAVAYNKINVGWKDNSNNETGFELYRSNSATGVFNIVGTTAANATSFTDSSLVPATTYYYKVQAVNKYGNSGLSRPDTTVGGSGLNYSYYTGSWSTLPNFTTLTPVKTGVTSNVDLSLATQSTNYGFLWQGYVKVLVATTYILGTTSDDGSDVWFNSLSPTGTPTVNNDGLHSPTSKTSAALNLAVGTYPICVEYFQSGGGATMSLTYQVPGVTQQTAVPSSVFYQAVIAPVPSATTFAAPAAPATPASFVATALSTSKIALSWHTVTSATGYQVTRSIGDSSHFILLTQLSAASASFTDSSLSANLTHYYKIKAIGNGGTSSMTVTAFATTKDNAPVITKLASQSVPFATSSTLAISATDADGDAITFTAQNLPYFAHLAAGVNNTASLQLNPAILDAGVYNNLKIIAADPYGGKDSTIFNLTVSSNYSPTIDSIADYTLNENDTLSIPLNAHDQNAGDILTWSVSNVPNAYSLINVANGQATLFLHPTYNASGIYRPIITVNDGNGGITTRQFNLTVNDANPTVKVYARFASQDQIGAPWNSITQLTTNNLVDAWGKTTNIGLAGQGTWFTTFNGGPTTGNNSGVYPDAVLEDYLYFGIYGGPDVETMEVTGLDTSRSYSLTFFGSSVWAGAADNGTTIYTVGNQSDTLEVQNNTQNTVTINTIKPASDGTITFSMSKGVNTPVGYINALVINSIYDDGTVPAAPLNLTAQNALNSVSLSWSNGAYNAAGFNIYRALASNQVYKLIGQTQAEQAAFTDTSITGTTQYLYKVAAYNTHGISPYSNIDTITTTDRVPQINALSDVGLKYNQTATVNILAKDDSTDHITLSVTGLPSFATFVDKGNGTGTITITPTSNSLGAYPVIVTATDLSNMSSSDTFNILISDPNISSVYLSFSDGYHPVPKPWNMLAGYPFPGTTFSNITDDGNSATGISVVLKNGFSGVVESGMQPVNGLGIYPNVVMRTAEYEPSTQKDTIQINGLSTTKKYNFVFFNSHDDGLVGLTNFTINSTTVSLNATDNISKTVQINGITPNASGTVYITVAKGTSADYAFISSLIIQGYNSTVTSLSPTNLRTTTITRNSIGLQWEDRSYSETGYQIWRAADSASAYTLLATVAANATTYTDANLITNHTYNYAVRAVYGSTYSGYSNTVTASTYAYSVYVNYTTSNDAKLPWNNTDAIPQAGYAWNNFFDETGITTSTGMQLLNNWAGLYNAGMNPLNNSGVVPDTVMIDSYGLFPGQTAVFQITGLNLGMKYDFTFFSSSQAYGDVNVAYTINGVITLLNASLNINGTQTIYGVTPDGYGNVTISVAAGTSTSQFGLIGALIMKGYTPSASKTIPSLGTSGMQNPFAGKENKSEDKTGKQTVETATMISAYPNPFHDYFTLSVPSQNQTDKIEVVMFDMQGKIVYENNFGNVHEGNNTLRIETGSKLSAGMYTVEIINADTKAFRTIRLVKE